MAAVTGRGDWIRRRPVYAGFALVVLAVAAWSLWPRRLAVESTLLQRGEVVEAFVEEGRTRLRERYIVGAPLHGVLERIDLEPGDAVRGGQPVATIRASRAALLDPVAREDAAAARRLAAEERAAAAAAVDAAAAVRRERGSALARAQRLAAQQLLARGELDALRAAVDVADADVRAARARLAAAQARERAARAVIALQGAAGADARRIIVEAPVAGRVVRRLAESEATVVAGQPLLEIGDLRDLEVVVDVLTADAVRIAPGTRVQLANWGGRRALEGVVARVEPGAFVKVSALGVEEQRVPVVVRLVHAPPVALGDGYRVDARFVVWRGASVPSLPLAALFRDGGRWAVYAVEGGRARLRHVRVGHVGEDRAEILDGLREGARVVVHPGDTVREGRRVAVAR